MAQAYQLIQAVTVGASGASTIDFTNIPQTYTDLMVVCSIRYTGTPNQIGDTTWIQFNGSTANQTSRMLAGNGSSASSYTDTKIFGQSPGASATASTFGNTVFYIPNYTGSTNKSVSIDGVTENNATTGYTELVAGLWSNTAAITSITLKEYGGTKTMVQYSTAYLYGIGGARATGGTITADSKYTYHTFTSSGTFTALEKIKGAEVLCIAGGGGGGSQDGAGGGAGGVFYAPSQPLSAGSSYSAIIGSGGAGGTSSGVGAVGSNSQFIYTANGGGGGAGRNTAPTAGGSGGGGNTNGGAQNYAVATQTSGTGYIGYGNNGGASANTGSGASGGGGGAGAAGGAGVGATPAGGNGGVGLSTFSSWGYATGTGQLSGGLYYYAGGGGGGSEGGTYGIGGLGGGGASNGSSAGTAGTANTGGGGGASGWAGSGTIYAGGAGGSGLVIVRYPN